MKASKLKKYKLSLYFLFFKKYRDYAAIVCLSVNDRSKVKSVISFKFLFFMIKSIVIIIYSNSFHI